MTSSSAPPAGSGGSRGGLGRPGGRSDPVRTAGPAGPDRGSGGALRAGIAIGAAYVLIGWRALLIPSLIRFVEPTFGQTDAGMGVYFFVTAAAYASGSLFGGRMIRAHGARLVLPLAGVLMAGGLIAQGLTGLWPLFVLAGILVSIGASTADVGINALVLDLFPEARGRALNLLHVGYAAGALAAPLVLASLVGLGVPWPWLMAGTGVVVLVAAAWMAVTVPARPVRIEPARDRPDVVGAEAHGQRLPRYLLVVAIAVACYVAAEAGVSDWLVRYLDSLPLTLASTALTLFWGGIASGRLVFARLGNRYDPRATASILALASAALLAVAMLVPVSPVSLLLFGAVGLGLGPIFPLLVAAAGARLPGRSATVTSTLIFAAVIGAVVYPPAIGFLSVVVGLQTAMFGVVILAAGSGVAARLAGRVRG